MTTTTTNDLVRQMIREHAPTALNRIARQPVTDHIIWEDDIMSLTPEAADAFPCENEGGVFPELSGGERITLVDSEGHKMCVANASYALTQEAKGMLVRVGTHKFQVS